MIRLKIILTNKTQYSIIKHHYNEAEAEQKNLFDNLLKTSSKGYYKL